LNDVEAQQNNFNRRGALRRERGSCSLGYFLSARGVLFGRAKIYALAGAGQREVAHLLEVIEAEMRVAMTLTGVSRVEAIDHENLADPALADLTCSPN
jgi:hypothetical protein